MDHLQTIRNKVEVAVPGATFGPPLQSEVIEVVERDLGHTIPLPLKEVYLACDGFTGPTYAPFLMRLADAAQSTLQQRTERLESWAHDFLLYGTNGLCGYLLLSIDGTHTVKLWHPGDEELEGLGSIWDAWRFIGRPFGLTH